MTRMFEEFNIHNYLLQPKPDVARIHFTEMTDWAVTQTYNIVHKSRMFFSFVGLHNVQSRKNIILYDQNEIGLLFVAITCEEGDEHGEGHSDFVYMNLKFEPGNHPPFQLSPTIQKTHSNLTGVHGGKSFNVDVLEEYILKTLYKNLQTEQSNSFLHKKNLNQVSIVNPNMFSDGLLSSTKLVRLSVRDLAQISLQDNIIHIDLRSSLCQFMLDRYLKTSVTPQSPVGLSRLTSLCSSYALFHQSTWRLVNISDFATYSDTAIINQGSNCYIEQKVVAVSVNVSSREVSSWSQPLVQYPSMQYSLVFSIQKNVLYILVALSIGPGTRNEVELFPSYSSVKPKEISNRFPSARLVHKSTQSEEGGRFLFRSNINYLFEVESPDNIDLAGTDNGLIWVDAHTISSALSDSTLVSIELRSLVFLLSSYLLSLSAK